MFLDEAIIDASGGNGGKGSVAWRREKYVPNGGPDGGEGGKGGDLILMADTNTDTLSDFASKKRFQAKHGQNGMGKNCAGKGGDDVILRVPPGTIVYDITEETRPVLLADLRIKGDQIIVAHGGKGGFGNTHFKSSTRQAPDFAELGEPGRRRRIKMELKLVADIGIIGYPSVGKSSFISAVSKARPKIADYPFTTLVPNLGVVRIFDRDLVLCDVPGLIEGASEGKGLGHQFLKHIERCGVLLHMLDVSRDDIVADYKAIRKELKKYSPTLAKKAEFVVLNKIDLVNGDTKPWADALKKAKIKLFGSVSSATHEGTDELLKKMLPLVLDERQKRLLEEEEAIDKDLPVLKPQLLSDKMGAFRVEQQEGKVVVYGRRLEQLTAMTNFSSAGARTRFRDVCQRIGLIRALEKSASESDRILIGTQDIGEYLR